MMREIAECVMQHPNITSTEIMQRCNLAPSSSARRIAFTALRALTTGGYVTRVVHQRVGVRGASRVSVFTPTDKLLTHGAPNMTTMPTDERVMNAVAERGMTMRELASALVLSYNTIRASVNRLNRRGAVVLEREGQRVTVHHALMRDPDDEPWTPQPYVNPIRARALGLARTKVG